MENNSNANDEQTKKSKGPPISNKNEKNESTNNNSSQPKTGNQKKNDFLSRIKFFEQKNVIQNKKPIIDYRKVKTHKDNKDNEAISSKNNNEKNLIKPKLEKIIQTKTIIEKPKIEENLEKSEKEKSKIAKNDKNEKKEIEIEKLEK